MLASRTRPCEERKRSVLGAVVASCRVGPLDRSHTTMLHRPPDTDIDGLGSHRKNKLVARLPVAPVTGSPDRPVGSSDLG